ncbi:hypothetical protein ACR77J_13765 [Tissierella praeacuta]|uniref:hypothetical protein n=1 Tax=Tissierella praeacuta TaxID=43131 RepID=UPI003DA3E978
MDFSSTQIQSALIAGAVSIIIWLLSFLAEPLKLNITHYFRLKLEHKYNERKKIKNILSKNKMFLLWAAEELNYRIWNLYNNYDKKWVDSNTTNKENLKGYYFKSFLYRISIFYTWIHKIESEIEYIDVTLADKEDLYFLKYLKVFTKLICNYQLINDYDKTYGSHSQKDHLFANNLTEQCRNLSQLDFMNDSVFLEWNLSHNNIFADYIKGIHPDENRYRWDVLQLLHILIMCFLNSYGYDYHYTTKEKFRNLLHAPYMHKRLIPNFINLISSFKMESEPELKKFILIYEFDSNI